MNNAAKGIKDYLAVVGGNKASDDRGHPYNCTTGGGEKPKAGACVECGAKAWAERLVDGRWYVSPWCEVCMLPGGQSKGASLSAIERRWTRAGLTLYEWRALAQIENERARRGEGPLCGERIRRILEPPDTRPFCVGVIMGRPSTGRTMRAASFARLALEAQGNADGGWHYDTGEVVYVREDQVIDRLPSTRAGHVPVEAYITPPVLILEDLGRGLVGRREGDWTVGQMRMLLLERMRRAKPTLITTGLSLASLAAIEGLGAEVQLKIMQAMGGVSEVVEGSGGGLVELHHEWVRDCTVGAPEGAFNLPHLARP